MGSKKIIQFSTILNPHKIKLSKFDDLGSKNFRQTCDVIILLIILIYYRYTYLINTYAIMNYGNSTCISKKKLICNLQTLETFTKPKLTLEQYSTGVQIAGGHLLVISIVNTRKIT